jgi:hypothetical protein
LWTRSTPCCASGSLQRRRPRRRRTDALDKMMTGRQRPEP